MRIYLQEKKAAGEITCVIERAMRYAAQISLLQCYAIINPSSYPFYTQKKCEHFSTHVVYYVTDF
jgi:hypothetical protein